MAGRWARITYLALAVVTILVAGVVRDTAPASLTGDEVLSKVLSVNMDCPEGLDSKDCMAKALRTFVLRMCFATAVFHLCLALFTIGASDYSNPRVMLHSGLWPVKLGMWLLLHVMVFFISSSFFLAFGWVALIASVFFLLIQIVIFIEWIYEWNETWVQLDGTENVTGPWHILILLISVLSLGAAIGMTVVMFMWFGKNTADPTAEGGCELYTFFTSFNLVFWLLLTLGSFRATAWNHATGILPSSLISAFMTFKVLMALYAQNQCNQLADGSDTSDKIPGPPQLLTAISIIIAIVLAAYNSVVITKAHEDGAFSCVSRAVPLVEMDNANTNNMEEGEASEARESEEPALSGPVGYNPAAFHFAFMLGILYVAMQLTNWNEDFKPGEIDKSKASMWIKVVDSWVLGLVYLWSLIAPVVLKDRTW
eukprot:CAMPEP_0181309496 /NCGR_PEP_ID=MMETSP1101-20121128/12044_1 /TAXON_ID=46948 /ORGANISM="Rhodomonas abbreviata, Strain Caron Lab Isolate" /LENGTH=424 /DNA_ID=CAMNT_0023415983 /DNA_START=228 /DNA_END=1502 /DNA_ORIENTATION=-